MDAETGSYCEDLNPLYASGQVPRSRGVPDLFAMTEQYGRAECGPSSLAAYLNISPKRAVDLLPLWKAKRRHSSKRTPDALASVGLPHKRVKLPARTKSLDNIPERAGFVEVKFLKEQGVEFSTRHIAAFDRNVHDELLIYDNNAIAKAYDGDDEYIADIAGFWFPHESWLRIVIPRIQGYYPSVVDYYLDHILVPK